jgi:hypothetical protein
MKFKTQKEKPWYLMQPRQFEDLVKVGIIDQQSYSFALQNAFLRSMFLITERLISDLPEENKEKNHIHQKWKCLKNIKIERIEKIPRLLSGF